MEQTNGELDPRIQIELENLNTATEEINKLEIELEEAKSTFRILLNESTRRLNLLRKKLGNCIEKSRPYYDAMERARLARIECQEAAAKFQRANEIHAAAKETVALAENQFMTNSHNWPFDNAWQEMLNHATQKVSEAEKKKAECHAEHQKKAHIVSRAEMEAQQIEERQRRNIQKSHSYFEEKQLCQDQLQTQKDRIEELEIQIKGTKASYAMSLKNLELISEEIHKNRSSDLGITPQGPREPGVGAELCTDDDDDDEDDDGAKNGRGQKKLSMKNMSTMPIADLINHYEKDFSLDTASLDTNSIFSEDRDDDDHKLAMEDGMNTPKGSTTGTSCSHNTGAGTTNSRNEPINSLNDSHELNLEELRQKVKVLAVRPVEGGDGQTKDCWESELNETVNKLDRLMMLQEHNSIGRNNVQTTLNANQHNSIGGGIVTEKPPIKPVQNSTSGQTALLTATSANSNTTKSFINNSLQAVQQKMEELLPNTQSELPLLSRISNEISANTANTVKVLKRRLSLN